MRQNFGNRIIGEVQRIEIGGAIYRYVHHQTAQFTHQRAVFIFRIYNIELGVGEAQEEFQNFLLDEQTFTAARGCDDHGVAVDENGAQSNNKIAADSVDTIINPAGHQYLLRVERNQGSNTLGGHSPEIGNTAQTVGHCSIEGVFLLPPHLGKAAVKVTGSGFQCIGFLIQFLQIIRKVGHRQKRQKHLLVIV